MVIAIDMRYLHDECAIIASLAGKAYKIFVCTICTDRNACLYSVLPVNIHS